MMQKKWWGWGALDKQFPLDANPDAWPYFKAKLGIVDEVQRPPVALEDIQLPPSRLDTDVVEAIVEAVGQMNFSRAAQDRLTHAYGKSYRDLMRLRMGAIGNAPDAVVLPTQEAHIEALLKLAATHGFAVIPFGGGTSVVGGLEMPDAQADRPFVSLDLGRMAELISVDPVSQTATVQAGIFGPRLEEQLQAQGMTLGHYPQSFEFSTLGGWVATRSAGQQSTRYGKIEQMVLALRMVTPTGVLETRALPASAQGPDLNQVAVGSEGIYGVITQVTVRVHAIPERREHFVMLFPSWEQGQKALREVLQSERHPATLRLSDVAETQALFKMREPARSPLQQWGQQVFKWYAARMKDIRRETACMLILGFEGSHEQVEQDRDAVMAACEQNRGISLGQGIGDKWYASRFEMPYLRDTLLDRGVFVDTLETSTTWDQVPALYDAVVAALEGAIRADGLAPMVLCHVSHPYHTGASLYFTFCAKQLAGDELAQWARYKRAATEAIVAHGGSLSHHHSVGLDHAPWAPAVLGDEGIRMLRGLKDTVDPQGVMNPGKIIGPL
jgi:alkyldihydroxyacetonephosphate synthase